MIRGFPGVQTEKTEIYNSSDVNKRARCQNEDAQSCRVHTAARPTLIYLAKMYKQPHKKTD